MYYIIKQVNTTNRDFFNSEAAKNRATWKQASGGGLSSVNYGGNYAAANFDAARGLIQYQSPGISGYGWKAAIGDLPTADPHFYVDILSNPKPTKDELLKAIAEAEAMKKEYERQLGVHEGRGDSTNAGIVTRWVEGVNEALGKLATMVDKFFGEGETKENIPGTELPTDNNVTPFTLSKSGKWAIGIGVTVVLGFGIFAAYKHFKA